MVGLYPTTGLLKAEKGRLSYKWTLNISEYRTSTNKKKNDNKWRTGGQGNLILEFPSPQNN